MATIGLSSLYYATVTKDDGTGATYGTPVAIAGAINAKISPKSSTEKLYADDIIAEQIITFGEIDVELETKELTLAARAALLGGEVKNGILIENADDISPDVAIGFKSKKSDGSYRYVWLLKGKFAPVEDEYATQEDKASFKTPKIKGTFVARAYDKYFRFIADDSDVAFTGEATWFASVPTVPTGV